MKIFKKDERGVAMVTVLLVGAALTALTSAAAFITIEELGATQADRNAAQALAFAEAGIDRMILKIRNNDFTWNNLSLAGCDADHPVLEIDGAIAPGTYETTLAVYNDDPNAPPADRFAPSPVACATASSTISSDTVRTFLLSSTGQQPLARRTIRQVIEIKPLGLPVGIYAYDRVDANGTVNMHNISMVSEKSIYNRDNLQFYGTDPYYKISAFYPGKVDLATLGAEQMPAAAHAKVALYYGPASKLTEHRDPRETYEPNCEANKGTRGQSQWDGSGTAILDVVTRDCATPPNDWPGSGYSSQGQLNPPVITEASWQPPNSKFTEEDRQSVAPTPTLSEQDYLTLSSAAKQTGLYCSGPTAANLSCSEVGKPMVPLPSGRLTVNEIDEITAQSFIVYIDFTNDGADPFAREVEWTGTADIGPCSFTPASSKSAVIVVRRGSVKVAGGAEINGAMLVPEGVMRSSGNFTIHGTIITRRLEVSGTATIQLSPCWLANLPGPFLDLTSTTWNEVDR